MARSSIRSDDPAPAMPPHGGKAEFMPFAAAVLAGAWLLFTVQPLLSRAILPWFGGSPAVWITCLVFFQTLLCAGYALALAIGRLAPRLQILVYPGLLAAAAASLPVLPAAAWRPDGDAEPASRILLMLLASAGPTYILLAAASPLLQSWFARRAPDRSPYPLFAVSSAGSLLGLLGYPFLIEPAFSLGRQSSLWTGVYLLFILATAACAWRLRGAVPSITPAPSGGVTDRDDRRPRPLLWGGWACAAVVLFMAVTEQMTQNLTAVPFLWVLPLAVYLLTFVSVFGRERSYRRPLWIPLALIAILALEMLRSGRVPAYSHWWQGLTLRGQILAMLGMLFALCQVCHGELHRLRPDRRRLGSFYLAMSIGGMVGGLLVGVAAPLVFPLQQELSAGLIGMALLLLLTLWREGKRLPRGNWLRSLRAAALAGFTLLFILTVIPARPLLESVIHVERTFFGLHRVQRLETSSPLHDHLVLMHGSTIHGAQYLDPSLRGVPTSYFAPATGIGLAMQTWLTTEASGRAMRMATLGLGAGTMAAYLRAGDTIRFYEIDPVVARLARRTFGRGDSEVGFTYLEDCPGRVELVLGDARISLERELAGGGREDSFDVLVVDVFSSASIPVHLYTLEALELYERCLRQDGLLAFHCSSHHLDLRPLLYQLADLLGMTCIHLANAAAEHPDGIEDPFHASLAAEWILMTRNQDFMRSFEEMIRPFVEVGELRAELGSGERFADIPVWTDDRSDLFALLRNRVRRVENEAILEQLSGGRER